MLIRAFLVLAFAGGAGALAFAQTTDDSDRSAQDRVRSGALQERAPGNWVRAAINRHNGGEDPNQGSSALAGGGATGTNGLSSLLPSSLQTLLNSFGGGLSTLGLGSLTDVIGGTTTTGTTTTGTTTTTGDGNAVDPRLQQLLDLRDAANGSSNAGTLKASTQSPYREFGGAIDRLSKPEDRQQTSGDDAALAELERPFRYRLFQAWTDTFSTALTVAFQTQQFIDVLESGLRPLIRPKPSAEQEVAIESLLNFLYQLYLDGIAGGSNTDTGDGDTTGDTDDDGSTGDVTDLPANDGDDTSGGSL